jgi:DNA-binding transcriptional MerR regulator
MTMELAIPRYFTVDSFAQASGLHPEMVVRLVDLGLLDAWRDGRGRLLFSPVQLARAARIQRLREGLAMNYAALGLVLDLLDRVETLEAALRSTTQGGRKRRWTPTG